MGLGAPSLLLQYYSPSTNGNCLRLGGMHSQCVWFKYKMVSHTATPAATPTVAGPDGERGRGRGGGTQGWRARAGSDGCGDSMGIPELILVSYLV